MQCSTWKYINSIPNTSVLNPLTIKKLPKNAHVKPFFPVTITRNLYFIILLQLLHVIVTDLLKINTYFPNSSLTQFSWEQNKNRALKSSLISFTFKI